MMTFNEFTEAVRADLASHLPEEFADAEAKIVTVTKNNGQQLTGVSIARGGAELRS